MCRHRLNHFYETDKNNLGIRTKRSKVVDEIDDFVLHEPRMPYVSFLVAENDDQGRIMPFLIVRRWLP